MRLIDADEYEKRIKPYDTEDVMDKALYNFAHGKLIGTPTAEKRGKWIVYGEFIDCSACRKEKWSRVPYESLVRGFRYCPNCGARMEG